MVEDAVQKHLALRGIKRDWSQAKAVGLKNSDFTNFPRISSNLPKRVNDDSLLKPSFYIYLNENIATLFMDLNSSDLHKHGGKEAIGYAPLSESVAAALLLENNIIDHSEKSLKLFDPFCGSGTFLLEAFSMARQDIIRKENPIVPYFRSLNQLDYKRWMEEQFQEDLSEWQLSLVGSDISGTAISSAYTNCLNFGDLNSILPINSNKVPPHVKFFENGPFKFYNTDFSDSVKLGIVPEGSSLISNIPWGKRSSLKFGEKEVEVLRSRFFNFVKRNKEDFKSVFIIDRISDELKTTKSDRIRELDWTCKRKMSVGGIQVGIYSYGKESTFLSLSLEDNEIEEANENNQIEQITPNNEISTDINKDTSSIEANILDGETKLAWIDFWKQMDSPEEKRKKYLVAKEKALAVKLPREIEVRRGDARRYRNRIILKEISRMKKREIHLFHKAHSKKVEDFRESKENEVKLKKTNQIVDNYLEDIDEEKALQLALNIKKAQKAKEKKLEKIELKYKKEKEARIVKKRLW